MPNCMEYDSREEVRRCQMCYFGYIKRAGEGKLEDKGTKECVKIPYEVEYFGLWVTAWERPSL